MPLAVSSAYERRRAHGSGRDWSARITRRAPCSQYSDK